SGRLVVGNTYRARSLSQHGIDRGRRPAVVLLEQVRVDRQRRRWRRVPEPVSDLGDGNAEGDQHRGVGVPQFMEAGVEAEITLCSGKAVRCPRTFGARRWKYERVVWRFAEPERDPHFKLLAAMLAQGVRHDAGEADQTHARFGLWPLEPDTVPHGLFERRV